MQIATIDFETYYGDGLGFKTQTTEEYIRDPRFEVICMAIKIDDGPTNYFAGYDAVKKHLQSIDWSDTAMLAHNIKFDGAVAKWIFGIDPAMFYDTLSMARALHGIEVGNSLGKLAEKYQLGVKGTEVVNAYGKRLADFTYDELQRYIEYCCNDVELTYKLFNILRRKFPEPEMELVDMTIRMFTHPAFEVDNALLVERLEEIRVEKKALLGSLMEKLGAGTEEAVRKMLSSNNQFADILRNMGVEPPMKLSPAALKRNEEKLTYAFSKTDEGFLSLQEHENLEVQYLCSVRLGTKSTIEESRIERFIGIGKRNFGRLPVPLRAYGAHTHRWAGDDKINFQNLPSRDRKKKALKNSVRAPEGYLVVNADSSQIEARILAWWAGQTDVVEQFANKEDVYSTFASRVFGFPVSKANPVERFVGKTCVLGLGFGTGHMKLKHTLKTQPPGADVTEEEAKRYVDIYREATPYITDLRNQCGRTVDDLIVRHFKPYYLGKHKIVQVHPQGILLPNELMLKYYDVHYDQTGKTVHKTRNGIEKIWAGTLLENVVQALAKIVVAQQMLWIRRQFPIALTVHDAATLVIPVHELQNALEYVDLCMSTAPAWAPGLPVACEIKYGESYGECG